MKNLKFEIERGNPWYVNNHIEMYQKKPYVRMVSERLKFIIKEISQYCSLDDKKNKILDAGCGDGFYLAHLCRIKNAKIFGIDYNPLRISRAKDMNNNVFLVSGNLNNMSIKDNTFDIVLLNHVLEHIKDDIGLLREIYRVLKIEGILILGIPNEGCLLAQIRNRILQRSCIKETDHINFYTENKIKEKLNFINLKIIKIKRDGFFFPYTKIYDILAGFNFGFKLLSFLGNIFKSQCAGLYLICKKA